MTTAIRLKVVRFQCPHCHRTHSKRAAADAHIARCWRNPQARACKTCAHFTPAAGLTCRRDGCKSFSFPSNSL